MKKPRVDIRDQKATIVLLDAALSVNGGSLDEDITAVWLAVKQALATSAHARGLGFSWTAKLHCMTPARMQARIERLDLNVELPPAEAAVDPQAGSTGTLPSARQENV